MRCSVALLTIWTVASWVSSASLPCLAGRTVIERKVFVRGRVLDPTAKPVASAKILLRNQDSGEIITETTDSKGDFSVQHPLCSSVSLEVVADEKHRLARAQYDQLTGRETKQMIIRLHRGFLITGKVVSAAKGLRDIDVLVASEHPEEAIYGGGLSRTSKDGTFRMVLTPGAKKLKVLNSERQDLPQVVERNIVVTTDSIIPEIELKPSQTSAPR
jgi:hypothetical protein